MTSPFDLIIAVLPAADGDEDVVVAGSAVVVNQFFKQLPALGP